MDEAVAASCCFQYLGKDPAVTSSKINIRVRGILSEVGEIPETCNDVICMSPPPLIEDIGKVDIVPFPFKCVICSPWVPAKESWVEPGVILDVRWSGEEVDVKPCCLRVLKN